MSTNSSSHPPGEAAAVLESIAEGYVLLDKDFVFRYVNAAAERTIGLTREAVLGRTVWEAFPETVGNRVEAELRRVMAERLTTELENYFEPWKRWFRARIAPAVPSGIVIYFQEITAQKDLEFDAAAARARLQLTQRASGVGTWEWDPATGRMYGSEEWLHLLGLERDEKDVFSAWVARIHPDDRDRVLAAHQDCISRGSSEVEYRCIRQATGETVWILRRSAMLIGDSTGPLRMVGVSIDVTARRKALDESERTLRLLETLTNHAPAGFLFLDTDMRFQFVNTALAEMNGLPVAGHLGRTPEEVVPALAAQGRAIFNQVMRTGEPVLDREIAGETPKVPGQTRYWSESWYPVRSQDGRLLGVGAVVIETTERKLAIEVLREREERYRLVASAANDAVWDWDLLKGEIVWNEAVTVLFHYPENLIDGSLAWWEDRIHPDDRLRVTTSLQRALDDAGCSAWSEEYRFRRADGTYAHVLDRGSIVRRGGHPVRAVGSMLDLTPIREAQEQLRQANAALRRSNAELQRFAHNISHDLQAPLRTISSFSQLLDRQYAQALGDDGQELTHRIVQGVERISRFVSDLLEFSRHTEETGPLEPVDCHEALQWALSNLENDIGQTGARITCGPLPTVLAGPRLASVFQNLVQNAIKYRSERPLEIHVSAQRQHGVWLISLGDNGIGFEPDDAERIFEAFQGLHSQERYPGSGLGLAICRGILQQYGGRIWATSQPGRGSTFHFTLAAV